MTDFKTLYSWVKGLPIVDWHNHLDMKALAEDRPLGSLYEVWVKADPYKHRAMRICGEAERVITGDASEDEKWAAWMRTLPKLVGNPLFAWAKMEMEWLGLFNAEAQSSREGTWIRELRNVSLVEWTPSNDNTVDEHLTRQVCTLVAGIDSRLNITAVTRHTRYTEQTRFLIDEIVKLRCRKMLFIHDKGRCAQIQVTRTGTHYQTLNRRQTHRSIYALSVQHSSTTATASDMCRNNLLLLRIDTQELAYTGTDITVTCAVETVATNRIFLIQLIRKRVHVCVIRHRLMECRIEDCYLRNARKNLLNCVNTLQVSRVVQRSQLHALDDHLFYLRSDEHGLVEFLSAVDYTVTDGVDLFEVLDATDLRIHQFL